LGIGGRVKIIQNPLFEDLKRILAESKIIIDSQREVSNTLTAIEAMSAGNIILIHRNSGCFTEVLKNGELGFGFENVEEGGRVLSEVLNKVDNIETKDLVERSKDFSEDNFIKRLNQIIMEN
jgi:glycosyltransferase involved in cell wall biosynthesis